MERSALETISQGPVGIVAGAVLGAAISWFFAWRSSRELRQVAVELRAEMQESRRLNVLALRALEGSGVIDPLARDASGNLTGISHRLSGSVDAGSEVVATRLDSGPGENG